MSIVVEVEVSPRRSRLWRQENADWYGQTTSLVKDMAIIRFNASKCKVMHMGSSNPSGNYSMGGLVLEHIDQEKDLGVSYQGL